MADEAKLAGILQSTLRVVFESDEQDATGSGVTRGKEYHDGNDEELKKKSECQGDKIAAEKVNICEGFKMGVRFGTEIVNEHIIASELSSHPSVVVADHQDNDSCVSSVTDVHAWSHAPLYPSTSLTIYAGREHMDAPAPQAAPQGTTTMVSSEGQSGMTMGTKEEMMRSNEDVGQRQKETGIKHRQLSSPAVEQLQEEMWQKHHQVSSPTSKEAIKQKHEEMLLKPCPREATSTESRTIALDVALAAGTGPQTESNIGAFSVVPDEGRQRMLPGFLSTHDVATDDNVPQERILEPSRSRPEQALVEAELVQDKIDVESGELVVAEKMDGRRARKRNALLLALAATIVVMLSTIVGILVRGNEIGEEFGDLPGEATLTGSTLNNSEALINSNPTAQMSNTTQHKCFEGSQELKDALDAYFDDRGPTSTVAKEYGWPIGSWCVSDVRFFSLSFKERQIGEDLGNWDMSNAENMEEMLRGNRNISANLGVQQWDTSNTLNMRAMFMATDWVEPMLDLSSWNTSQVTSLNQIFRLSDVEEPGVKNWDTAGVIDIAHLADGNEFFNEDLSAWDVGAVRNMRSTFQTARSFNQDIGSWNTRSLQDLGNAFIGADSFNQDLSSWNVSSVTNLRRTFQGANSFSHDLCAWGAQLPPDARVEDMFVGTACPNQSDPIIPGGPFCFNCN